MPTMTVQLRHPTRADTPIRLVTADALSAALKEAPESTRRWLQSTGFKAAPHSHALVPAPDGGLQQVWAGAAPDDPWQLASLSARLPEGRYAIDPAGLQPDAADAAMAWSLGLYRFARYKPARKSAATTLVLPAGEAARRGLRLAEAIAATRDLVNTPAEHMGPAELAAAVRAVAKVHGAKVREVVGDALLRRRFPAIHAVGRAAARAPRLIEMNWGDPKHPRLAIVGKGVCFDTGGLDLKTSAGMRLMKKDMGGAANALGLARLVMAEKLPVRLQLLIPAVENAVAGNAYRPGDVVPTRAGLQVEIGNTDAEGRVILSDALAYAAEAGPALLIDMATLTGAARTALGPQLPALFARSTPLARELVDLGLSTGDPVWHMPLWAPYHADIESTLGDIVNTGKSGMAGAVTAALFLQDFVPAGIEWLHLDLYAWNSEARPGRPVGGEAQSVRTLLAYLQRHFGAR
jgi:leucyl aminopeptidase